MKQEKKDYGVARLNPFTPSPVTSPGFESLVKVYNGFPLYAYCFDPSLRVMTVMFAGRFDCDVAVYGGHADAHSPVQLLTPFESAEYV